MIPKKKLETSCKTIYLIEVPISRQSSPSGENSGWPNRNYYLEGPKLLT